MMAGGREELGARGPMFSAVQQGLWVFCGSRGCQESASFELLFSVRLPLTWPAGEEQQSVVRYSESVAWGRWVGPAGGERIKGVSPSGEVCSGEAPGTQEH